MKKLLKMIFHVLFVLVGVLALTYVILLYQVKGDISEAPSIAGHKAMTVLSNSMSPTFEAGDVIIIDTEREPNVQEVVTFANGEGKLITHRVTEKLEQDGKVLFRTKGDFNDQADPGYVQANQIIGVKTHIIPNLGYFTHFIAGKIGIFLFVVLPITIYIIIEIFQRLGILSKEIEQ